MSESFEKAVEAASLATLGRPTLSVNTTRAALRAALPHLTADDLRDTPAARERGGGMIYDIEGDSLYPTKETK